MLGAREDSSSLTLESLLKVNNLSEAQVNMEIKNYDVIGLAEQFDGVEDYIDNEQFRLKPAQKAHVRELKNRSCSEAVKMLLRCWKQRDPHQATFKALLKILLERSKTKVALDVCGYVKTRQLETSETQGTSRHTQGTSETQGTSRHAQSSHSPWQFNMKTISILIAVIAFTCVPMVLAHQDSPRTVILQSHDLIMTDFEQHKREDDMWFSAPVYTHQDGYKICLGVFANGELTGKGTHITVAVYFMRGEFDDFLKWPFRGIIYFQLVDQLHGIDHLEHMVPYNSSVPDKHCSRVTDRDTAVWGWGPDRLIAHTKLEPKYLRNDCLKFRIPRIVIYGHPTSPIFEPEQTIFEPKQKLEHFKKPKQKKVITIAIDNISSFIIEPQHEHSFKWENNGFAIYSPNNSIEHLTTCVVHIYSSLAGQYIFPSNYQLVSAVYWIHPSPTCKFKKPLTIKIQHCASKAHRLTFVRASSEQHPPYRFQIHSKHGIFNNSYGELNVTGFSAFAITHKGQFGERFYKVKLFYLGSTLQSWVIYLAITWDTEIHNKVRRGL